MSTHYPPLGAPGRCRLWVDTDDGRRVLVATQRFTYGPRGLSEQVVFRDIPPLHGTARLEFGARWPILGWMWATTADSWTITPGWRTVTVEPTPLQITSP